MEVDDVLGAGVVLEALIVVKGASAVWWTIRVGSGQKLEIEVGIINLHRRK